MPDMKNDNTNIKLLALHCPNTRGGKRYGAGRKRLPPNRQRVAFTVRILRDAIQMVRSISRKAGMSQARVVEDVIMHVGGNYFFPKVQPRKRKGKSKPKGVPKMDKGITIDV